MNNTLIKYALAFTLCVFGGLIGSFWGSSLRSHHASNREGDLLRTRRVELTDVSGRVRAVLGSDTTEVFLRMLDPSGGPVLSVSIPSTPVPYSPNSTRANSTGVYSLPGVVINNAAGKSAVVIGVNDAGEGHMSFTGTSANGAEIERVLLGRLTLSDVQPDAGGWGLLVKGRDSRGKHLGTGIGIYASEELMGNPYITPVIH